MYQLVYIYILYCIVYLNSFRRLPSSETPSQYIHNRLLYTDYYIHSTTEYISKLAVKTIIWVEPSSSHILGPVLHCYAVCSQGPGLSSVAPSLEQSSITPKSVCTRTIFVPVHTVCCSILQLQLLCGSQPVTVQVWAPLLPVFPVFQ